MDSGKFKHKYRIASNRMKGWDYTAVGWYFITICTRCRILFFGDVHAETMRRSPLGEIAHQCWLAIPNHFPHTSLSEFVIMPNHINGIILINAPEITTGIVETQHAASLPQNIRDRPPEKAQQKSLLKAGSISAIVRSYKSAVTRWAGKNGYPNFGWQAGYYDHIVRDEKSMEEIFRYIEGNPAKWADDEYYSR